MTTTIKDITVLLDNADVGYNNGYTEGYDDGMQHEDYGT